MIGLSGIDSGVDAGEMLTFESKGLGTKGNLRNIFLVIRKRYRQTGSCVIDVFITKSCGFSPLQIQ